VCVGWYFLIAHGAERQRGRFQTAAALGGRQQFAAMTLKSSELVIDAGANDVHVIDAGCR
jgi:hypothetical protein